MHPRVLELWQVVTVTLLVLMLVEQPGWHPLLVRLLEVLVERALGWPHPLLDRLLVRWQ
jgi:hypothetical protein